MVKQKRYAYLLKHFLMPSASKNIKAEAVLVHILCKICAFVEVYRQRWHLFFMLWLHGHVVCVVITISFFCCIAGVVGLTIWKDIYASSHISILQNSLSQKCQHVAALLFAVIEVQTPSCTDMPCRWMAPTQGKYILSCLVMMHWDLTLKCAL